MREHPERRVFLPVGPRVLNYTANSRREIYRNETRRNVMCRVAYANIAVYVLFDVAHKFRAGRRASSPGPSADIIFRRLPMGLRKKRC